MENENYTHLKVLLESCGLSEVEITDLECVNDKVKIEGTFNETKFSTYEFKSFVEKIVELKMKNVECAGKRLVFSVVYQKFDIDKKDWYPALDEWTMYKW
jgi:hypothetical protein